MVLVTVMSILSGVAFQHWSILDRREREAELMFVQKQYAMALLEYQTDRGGPPTDLEMLDERGSRNQRFIRRMWEDPMTRDGEGAGEEEGLDRWCLIQAGPNNTPISSCPREDPNTFELSPFEQPIVPTASEGMPIIGVASRSRERAYRLWNDRETYAEWVYTIQDLQNEAAQILNVVQ
jgi:type II secretory pathway pseudopilin PulG